MTNTNINLGINGSLIIKDNSGNIKENTFDSENYFNPITIRHNGDLNKKIDGNYDVDCTGDYTFRSGNMDLKTSNDFKFQIFGDGEFISSSNLFFTSNNGKIRIEDKIIIFKNELNSDGTNTVIIDNLPSSGVGNLTISCKGDGVSSSNYQGEFRLIKQTGINGIITLIQESLGAGGESVIVNWIDGVNNVIEMSFNMNLSTIYTNPINNIECVYNIA